MTGTNNGSGTTTVQAVPSKILVTDYLTGPGRQSTPFRQALRISSSSIATRTWCWDLFESEYERSQATSPNYPGWIASIVGNTITWTDGNPADTIVWTKTTDPASTIVVTDYTNQNGVPVHVVENGTNKFVMVDGVGNTSMGHFLTATTGWPTGIRPTWQLSAATR